MSECRLPVNELTARERECLALACEGLSNQDIAERLFISLKTAQRHMSNCHQKFGTTSGRQLVAKAYELGYANNGKHQRLIALLEEVRMLLPDILSKVRE